jgi:hypothetical protein
MVVETAVVEVHEQLQRELDAARLALVSLIAAAPDEQLRSVEAELEALAPRSDMSRAALDELRISWQASREKERAQ